MIVGPALVCHPIPVVKIHRGIDGISVFDWTAKILRNQQGWSTECMRKHWVL
jgi:hypothetical protein